MQEKQLNDWTDFVRYIESLPPNQDERVSAPLLFRGHADASWRLNTTLERYGCKEMPLAEYYESIYEAKSEIETFTGRQWQLDNPPEYSKWLRLHEKGKLPWREFPGYEYMIFLRHHGFPSPLLDWTHSPYIAAFFAFNDAFDKSGRVSIYQYSGGSKDWKVFSLRSRHCSCRRSLSAGLNVPNVVIVGRFSGDNYWPVLDDS